MIRLHHTPIAAMMALLLLVASCTKRPESAPNVLLISIDSLRADHLGSYGYHRDTSPNLDALARNGARFEVAVAPSPWTLPSHVTMMTGRHPVAHGVRTNRSRLGDDIPTVAEALRKNGYATAGFVAGPYLRSEYGYHRGFTEFDESLAAVDTKRSHQGISSPQMVDKVLAWIDKWSATREQPFFAFLHLWDVHYDFAPPPPFDHLFDPDYEGTVDGSAIGLLKPDIAPRDLEHVIALYDGEIRFTDHELGRLFTFLRERKLMENTIIVVTADHGEEFFEHGSIGHLLAIFDESVRVPLIVHFPKAVRAGQVFDQQVRLMDLAPTILGLAGQPGMPSLGMPVEAPIQDRDLSPWLREDFLAGAFPDNVAFLENYGASRVGVRSNRGKLIRHNKDYYELYNVNPELGEKERDRSTDDTTRAVLADLVAEEHAWNDWQEKGAVKAPDLELPGSLRGQLEALGYIEP